MDEENKDFWREEAEESNVELAPEEPEDFEAQTFFDEPEEESVEPFVPTDAYRSKIRRRRRGHTHKRRAIWIVLLLVGAALLVLAGVYAYKLVNNPASFFSATPTPEATVVVAEVEESEAPELTPTPTVSPTPDPYAVIYEQADLSMMQNIVNVLIIGVDYAEERETWSGKHDYHADVMMIMAINFDENRVDLISLPRDTYANIPGVKGIYKLNAALNCGGGFEAGGGAGFLKCCETASWMIGEIPVDYYYAVTMPAVKQLVDTVGGVDYDLELSFTMVGRHYNKGMQHLDGQGVLDYLRVRKNVQGSGDLNRINRQKQMLIALFKTMQEQNLILKIPDIVSSFSGQLYTNCSLEQTMALALFAYDLSSENIGMYSMSGVMKNIFNWNFCLTDQSNRVDIVKTVYGVDVPKYLEYTSTYAQYRWADMVADRYLSTTKSFTSYLRNYSPDSLGSGGGSSTAGDPALPEGDGTDGANDAPGGAVIDPTQGAAWHGAPFSVMPLAAKSPSLLLGEGEDLEPPADDATGTDDPSAVAGMNHYQMYFDYFDVRSALENAVEKAAGHAKRYRNGESSSLADYVTELNEYSSLLRSYAVELAAATGYSTGSFSWTYRFDKDSDFNEVYVDFR